MNVDGALHEVDVCPLERECLPALLFEHIAREENGCFTVAGRELSDDVQRALEEGGYDRIERELVGGGVHESLHALLDELEAKTAPA